MTARKPAECGTAGAVARHQREGTPEHPEDRAAFRKYHRDRARHVKASRLAKAVARRRRLEAATVTVAQREDPALLAAHFAGDLVLG